MRVLFVVLGIAAGTMLAWILNKLLAGKIENRNQRITLKVIAYVVCILLSTGFAVIGSLPAVLDKFIVNKIELIEVNLSAMFPDSNVLETAIDISDIAAISDELQQSVNKINSGDNGFLESLVFGIFTNRLNGYLHAVGNGITTVTMMTDNNGKVTPRSILYGLKDMALKTLSPYFVAGKIVIALLLVVYCGVYAGIAAYFKKGGTIYNRSIVFGDADSTAHPDTGKPENPVHSANS